MKHKELVPKRRFEGFDEQWILTELGDVADFFNNKRIPIDTQKRIKGIYPYYGATGVIDYVNDYIFEGEYVLFAEDGENILSRNSPLAYLTIGKFWVNNHAHVMNMKSGSNLFLIQLLERQEYNKFNSGTAQPKLNGEVVRKMKFYFSPVKEQQKIGQFFKHLDDMIALQQRKIDKTKALKSAYLAEMFPAVGERVPKRRFEGFTGAWKKIRLEGLFYQSGSGGTPKTTKKDYYGGDIPFLGISDITNSDGYIYQTEKRITKEGLNNSAAWIVPKESISLAMYASVGKVAILKVESATSQAFYNMVIENQATRDYVYQYLVKMEVENMWNKIISTGTQANLNAEKVRNLTMPIPTDIKERKRIGSFFKNLDNQISIEEKKLVKLEKLKQAHLHEMFV